MSLKSVVIIISSIVLTFCFVGSVVMIIILIKDIWFEKEEK